MKKYYSIKKSLLNNSIYSQKNVVTNDFSFARNFNLNPNPLLTMLNSFRFFVFFTFFSLFFTHLSFSQSPCDSVGVCSADFTIILPGVNDICEFDLPCPPVIDEQAGCELFGFAFQRELFQIDNDTKEEKIKWSIINWCDFQTGSEEVELPSLDVNGDGVFGDPYEVVVRNDSVYISLPDQDLTFLDIYSGILIYSFTSNFYIKKGLAFNVFEDKIQNCEKDGSELGLEGWRVQITSKPSGETHFIETDAAGKINTDIYVPENDDALTANIVSALNLGGSCNTTFGYTNTQDLSLIEAEFPIRLISDCPLLTVDVAAIRVRRCFTNAYTVHYCNYSTETVTGGRVEVLLDANLIFDDTLTPPIWTNPEENLYVFDLPDLLAGDCGRFTFYAIASCDAERGETHCVEAHIFPDVICETINDNWTGASIKVDGSCDGDSVRFLIKNIGKADMTKESGFIVTEDVLMLRRGAFKLRAGESMSLSLVADGTTYHLLAEQEDFHPGRSKPTVFVEGCGGINRVGLVNAIAADDGNPFISKNCQINVGAFDPNDKSATPEGVGSEHFINKNTDINYKIRFQNTGTDTAFNIVILDTLSNQLDAASVVPGAASHAYQFELIRDAATNLSILQFTFSNVMLPDSNINEPGSHGFFQFKVAQKLDLEDGVLLENSAAIYFDFNEPIITNTVFHTIGMPLGRFSTSITNSFVPSRKVQLQPNPFYEKTTITIEGATLKKGNIALFDVMGKVVLQQSFSGNSVDLYRKNLSNGFYFYKIIGDNQPIASGKVLIEGN